jgi:hypothetical protein
MTDKLTFDNWWADFSYKSRNDKDGGRDMLDRLKLEVQSFTKDKREAFIDELLKRKNLVFFACELIPFYGNQSQIAEIKKRAAKLIERGRFEEILPEYLKVIIKNFEPADIQLLNRYYLNYQDELTFRIPLDLFEIDQELFLNAFAKYLKNYSVEKLCEYDGLLYLTFNPDAIEFLIAELPLELSFKMKSFAKKKAKHLMVVRDKELSERLLKLGQ